MPFAIPSILLWFLGPLGRYVGMALLAAALVGGIYGKGRYDDHVAYTHKLQVKKEHDITKGNAARERAVKRYDAGRLHDDGFSRD